MLKKLVCIGITFLLIVYFTFTIIFIDPNLNKRKCTKVAVDIVKNDTTSYLNEVQVRSFLDRLKLNPIGKNIKGINTRIIEKALKKHKLIKKAEVYKTVESTIRIKVYQRIFVLRVISGNADYYIDRDQEIIPVPVGVAAYVPLASGAIDEKFAIEQLYPLALFLQKNKFWDTQIEQIYVNDDSEIELMPRVGNHRIVLGEIQNFEKKLGNLMLFYKKVLNTIGWNRYSIINLKYKNQIICTIAN